MRMRTLLLAVILAALAFPLLALVGCSGGDSPTISATLTATPETVAPGGDVTLSWTTTGADRVTSNFADECALSSSAVVTVNKTGTFYIRAWNGKDYVQREAVVVVDIP